MSHKNVVSPCSPKHTIRSQAIYAIPAHQYTDKCMFTLEMCKTITHPHCINTIWKSVTLRANRISGMKRNSLSSQPTNSKFNLFILFGVGLFVYDFFLSLVKLFIV